MYFPTYPIERTHFSHCEIQFDFDKMEQFQQPQDLVATPQNPRYQTGFVTIWRTGTNETLTGNDFCVHS